MGVTSQLVAGILQEWEAAESVSPEHLASVILDFAKTEDDAPSPVASPQTEVAIVNAPTESEVAEAVPVSGAVVTADGADGAASAAPEAPTPQPLEAGSLIGSAESVSCQKAEQ